MDVAVVRTLGRTTASPPIITSAERMIVPTTSKQRPLTAEETEAMREAAVLIRTHLWLGPLPPPPPHPSQGPWTMGRDLSIWKRLLLSGRSPSDINSAITNVRTVLGPDHTDVPLRMTVFYNGQGYAVPMFEQAVGLAHKKETPRKSHLPPTVRDVLRAMVG